MYGQAHCSSSRSPSVDDEYISSRPLLNILEAYEPDARNLVGCIPKRNSAKHPYENREQQKELRKQRNRQSARESRERKKNYQDLLERTITKLHAETSSLKESETRLKEEVVSLRKEKELLQSIVVRLVPPSTLTSLISLNSTADTKPPLDTDDSTKVTTKPVLLKQECYETPSDHPVPVSVQLFQSDNFTL